MVTSVSEYREVDCPNCGNALRAEIWVLINAEARSDLLRQIEDGTLHTIRCQRCGNRYHLGTPLFLYLSYPRPHLIFSPIIAESEQHAREQLELAIAPLRQLASSQWQDTWLEQGIPVIPRDELPRVLNWIAEDRMERELQSDRIRHVAVAAREAVDVLPPEERARAMLEKMLAGEAIALRPDDFDGTLFRVLRELQSEAQFGSERSQRLHAISRHLKEKQEQIRASSGTLSADMNEAIRALFFANNWKEVQQAVELYPQLLSNEADDVLQQMANNKEHEEGRIFIGEYRTVLRRCKEVGTSQAIAEKINQSEAHLPPEIDRLLEEINRLGELGQVPYLIQLCEQALSLFSIEQDPSLWADLQNKLATSLIENPLGNREENIELAIEACHRALQVCTREDRPESWASTVHNLAIAYYSRIRGDREENLEMAIRLSEQALEVRTRETAPAKWALTIGNMAAAYLKRTKGNKEENTERAIDLIHQSLQVRKREVVPVEWAYTVMNLGVAYTHRSRGGREQNIEQAIAAFSDALGILTRRNAPAYWAFTMMNLGDAYADRVLGGRSENIELAIQAYKQALEELSYDTTPIEWAKAMEQLGVAYAKRVVGDSEDNIERAINIWQRVLRTITLEAMPTEWAEIMINLAGVYVNRNRRDRAENVELAIAIYQQVLQVLTCESSPENWMVAANNLGVAYSTRVHGKRAENIEQAIQVYERILETQERLGMFAERVGTLTRLGAMYGDRLLGDLAENKERGIRLLEQAVQTLSRKETPVEWATAMAELALAYGMRIRGSLAENIEAAIDAFAQALEELTAQNAPLDWATAVHNLANAYCLRVYGNRAENIEQAIHHFNQALSVRTRASRPIEWASSISDRGVAYRDRVYGNRSENVEKSIEDSLQALEVLDPGTAPIEWARAKAHLGNAYRERIRGDAADSIESAITAFGQALTVLTYEDTPVEWAMTMGALGSAHQLRTIGDPAGNIETAIRIYKEITETVTIETVPRAWSTSMMELGNSFQQRHLGDPAENIERAIEAYERASRVPTCEVEPIEYSKISLNLANAYLARRRGDREDNLELAIQSCQSALRVITRESSPADWALGMNNLATIYAERKKGDRSENITQAINYLNQALLVFDPELFPRECRRSARNLGDLYLQKEDWRAARGVFAAGIRAADTAYRSTYIPAGREIENEQNEALFEGMLTACIHLRDDLDCRRDGMVYADKGKGRLFLEQMGQSDFPPPPGVPSDLLNEETSALSQLRKLQQVLLAATLANERQVEIGTQQKALQDRLTRIWESMAHECPSANEYVALRRGESPVWEDLGELARSLEPGTALIEFFILEDGIAAFVLRDARESPEVFFLPISRDRLLGRYLRSYEEEVLQRRWRQKDHNWLMLGEELLAPLRPALDGVDLVYFVPHYWLHLLPLHALNVGGQPFISQFNVAYAPSAAILTRILRRSVHTEKDGEALVMAYTAGSDPIELALFFGEARAISECFRCQPLLGEAASGSALQQLAPSASLIHLSCHGSFTSDDPLASAVHLADGAFTARKWMELQLHADIVTLSACETGISGLSSGDEVTGLSRALLYAGASSALLTLWSVNAATTLLWMKDFYTRARYRDASGKRCSKASAFRQATLALRQKHPDPYHWASFKLFGNYR